jgi:flagellar hook-length control protein FliK
VLQLVNANVLASARAELADKPAVQAAQPSPTEQAPAHFSLEAEAPQPAELDGASTADSWPPAELSAELDAALALMAAPELPQVVQALPSDTALSQAEQWLGSMLQQQAVQLSAREAAEERAEPAAVTQVLPGLLQAPALPLSQAPARAQASATALGGTPAGVMATQAALLPQAADFTAAAPLAPAADALAAAASPAPGAESSAKALLSALEPLLPALPEQASSPSPLSAPALDGAPPALPVSTLKLQAPQAQYGQQMLNSLRDSVELQLSQQVQNATIRLDPPELGSLEIFLRHDNGRLTVQLSASNSEVTRLLQQTGERLRQELVGQNFVQVNVQVSTDSQGGRHGGQPAQSPLWADERIRAGQDEPDEAPESRSLASPDVLVTV